MPTFEEIEAMTRPDSGPLVFDFDSLEAATRPQSVAPPLAGRMGRIAVEQGLQQPGAEFIAPQPDAPVSGYMEDIGRGLTRGVPEISRQIGGALEAFTPFETTRDAGRRLRTEAEGQQSLTPAPQTIPGQIAQSVPSLAAGIGAGVAGAMAAPVVGLGAGLAGVASGAGVAGIQSGGGAYADALERLDQRGITGPEAEADARAGAGAVAIVSAITNTVPIAGYLSRIAPTSLGRAMDRIAGNVAGRLVLQAAAEGSQEAVEEFSVIVAQDLAENDPQAYRGLVGRIGTAALGGAVLGGGARAGMDVAGRIGGGVPRGTIVSENPEKDIPESEKPISGGFGRGSGPLPLAEPATSPDTAAGAAPTPEPTLDDVVAALRASRAVPVAPPQPEPQPVTEIPLSQQVEAERGRQAQPVVEQRVAGVEQGEPPAPILQEPQDAATATPPSPAPKRGSKRVRTPDAVRPVGGVPNDAGSPVPLDQGVSGVVSERGQAPAEPRGDVGVESGRAAREREIQRLRADNKAVLATPLMSEGAISPTQINRMGEREKLKWQANAQKRMAIESEIRSLSRSDDEIAYAEKKAADKKRESRAVQLRSMIQTWNQVGKGKSGKIRPTIQAEIDKAQAELDTLEGTNAQPTPQAPLQSQTPQAEAADEYEYVTEEADAESLGIPESLAAAMPESGTALEENESGGFDLVFERPVTLAEGRKLKSAGWVRDAVNKGRYFYESKAADKPQVSRTPASKPQEPSPTPPAPAAKQPWEMTRGEVASRVLKGRHPYLQVRKENDGRWAAYAIGTSNRWEGLENQTFSTRLKAEQAVKDLEWEAAKKKHRASVESALREGKPVPESVLADYPDLAGKAKPTVADKLGDIEQAAKERRESRRIKRGKDTGASTLPEDAIDFIIETSAGAAKDLVLTAQAIRQYVAERIPEKFRGQLDQIVAAVTRAINSSLSDDKKSVVPSKLLAALKDIDKENKFGRPDLANPGTSPAAREFVDTVDEARNRAGQPERKPDAETKRLAAKRDPAEVRKMILERADSGEQLSDEETLAAKSVVDEAARESLNSTDKRKQYEAAELVNAYRMTGTEQARAFRQRRDETLSPLERQRNTLIQYATEPTPKLAERLDDLTERIKKSTSPAEKLSLVEQRKRLLERYAEQNTKTAEALADIGLNPATMTDAQLTDRRTAARVVRTINSAKATPWHWALEWWINAILSGPPTQIVNATGNAAFATWDQTVQKLVEASVNLVAKAPNAPTFGEIKAAWQSFLPSLSRAGQNFLTAFHTEMPVFADDIAIARGEPTTLYGTEKLDIREGRHAIPGKTGRVVRIPTRTLLAVDELFKTIVGTMEANAAAYRMAKEEGLSGEAAYTRAGELVKDLTSPLWDKALEEARKITFQAKLGKFGEGVLRIRNDYPALTFILPFVSTPLNIFKAGIRKTPFSVFLTMHRAASHGLVKMGWSKSGWNYDRTKVVDDLSDNLIGLALLTALMPLVGDDENEPWITGSGASDSGKRALQYRTAPPQSIRMGDKWVSYSRVEPFATAISISTDLANALAGNSDLSLAERAIETFKGQIKDKTFLSGVSDIMEVFQDGSPGISEAGRFASNFAASWVPNVVRSTARASDPFQRETRVWGSPRDAAFWEQLGGRTLQRAVPIPLTAPPPKHDLWGRPIKAGGIAHPAADFLYRAVVPFGIANDISTKPDRVIVRWNSLHPDSTYAPRPPTPYITKDGKRIPMTDQQYADFTRKAGSAALARLERVNMNEKNPTERDMAIIKKIIEEERSIARKSALQ